MANAKKCDRCGAVYTNCKDVTIYPVTAPDYDKSAKTINIVYGNWNDWCWARPLDLCPDCVDKLIEYFSDGRGEQK